MRLRPGSARAAVCLCLLLSCACANEESPPGHGPDFDPPAVIETFPVYGSAVPELDEDAYVRFDEPLGDPRSVANLMITSPSWQYEVRVGRTTVRVRPRDGWRPDVVYRFQIPPGVRDLIRNVTREPIELLFTTGASLTDTRTTGKVLNRETVRTVRDASVLVIGSDSIPYAAVTDTGGSFSVPSLPIGDYWAYGFRDDNRNRRLDREFEPYDSGRVSLPDAQAAVVLELWLTVPDSTPPVLVSASALDSVRLRLEFDDLLEPEMDISQASVRVTGEDPGGVWPVESFMVGQEAPPDSAATDSTIAGAPRLPAAVGPQEEPESELRARPEATVTVRLGRPLVEGSYAVHAGGFPNLRGLRGGGDTTLLYALPSPPPEGDAGGPPDDPETARDEGAVAPSEPPPTARDGESLEGGVPPEDRGNG